MSEPDLLPRTVLISRCAVLVGTLALLVMFTGELIGEAWVWIAALGMVALGYPLIAIMVRRAPPGMARARALRRANLLVTPVCAALVIPLAGSLAGRPMGRWSELALFAGLLGLVAATFADFARFSIPDSWRDLDRPRWLWSPSARTNLGIALASLPVTALGFWWVTGVTGDGGCVVDSTCSFGVPFSFLYIGERIGSRMDWGDFWRDVGLLATVIPAIHEIATSRLRVLFALYLAAVGALVFFSANWDSESSMRVWMQVDLLGR